MKACTHILPGLPVDVLIGMSELCKNRFKIDFHAREVMVKDDIRVPLFEPGIKEFTRAVVNDSRLQPSKLVLLEQGSELSQSNPVREQKLLDVLEESIQPGHTPEFYNELHQLIREFARTFALEDETLRPCGFVAPRIEFLEENVVIRSRCYKYAEKEREFIKAQVDEWVQQGICEPCNSDFASPVVVVSKGHKEGEMVKPRLCVNYAKLNSVIRTCLYPLPNIEYLLSKLEGARFFVSLDLRRGYLQVPIPPEDKRYYSFITPFGLYTFNRMPFGITIAPGIFQNFIDVTTNGIPNVLVYLDDLLVYASTPEELLIALRRVLEALERDGWQISSKKCVFGARQIKLLGHIISENGVEMDPAKIESITKFQPPRDVSTLRSFLGLASYYRKFLYMFSARTKPLTMLLQKGVPYEWGESQQKAFEDLKKA